MDKLIDYGGYAAYRKTVTELTANLKTLLELSGMEQKALFEKYQTDENGLDPVQAADRLEEYGKNIIDFGNEKSLAVRIKDAIINPFNIVIFAQIMKVIYIKRHKDWY